MGYCIDVHGELTIKEEKIPLAIDCLKELMKGARLSWVHTEKVVERLEANDLLGALRELSYSFVEIQTNLLRNPPGPSLGSIFVCGAKSESICSMFYF